MQVFDQTIKDTLTEKLKALEAIFDANVVFYYGAIEPGMIKVFRDFIERSANVKPKRSELAMFVNTPGGSVEAAEKMVEIIRAHYTSVSFVVPDFAMSAGTILCMSGDRILMDYSSSLGPIDPQVYNGAEWVPALGYLDKVEELLEKAQNGTLTNAEFLILQNQDLALLSRYEQARDLTRTLLKKWLVEYKFRTWTVHETSIEKKGQPVSLEEKEVRAAEIALKLGDNKLWHSHGRMIGPDTLKSVLRLKIDDYSSDEERRNAIRSYNDLLTEYIARGGISFFLHSRDYF